MHAQSPFPSHRFCEGREAAQWVYHCQRQFADSHRSSTCEILSSSRLFHRQGRGRRRLLTILLFLRLLFSIRRLLWTLWFRCAQQYFVALFQTVFDLDKFVIEFTNFHHSLFWLMPACQITNLLSIRR